MVKFNETFIGRAWSLSNNPPGELVYAQPDDHLVYSIVESNWFNHQTSSKIEYSGSFDQGILFLFLNEKI